MEYGGAFIDLLWEPILNSIHEDGVLLVLGTGYDYFLYCDGYVIFLALEGVDFIHIRDVASASSKYETSKVFHNSKVVIIVT